MADGFNETPVRGKHRHNTAAPAETALAVLPAVATNADPAFTEGNLVGLSTDLTGNLRVVISGSDNAGGTLVDVSDRSGRLLGVVTLDTATLAALESVDLNAATLAALESVDLNQATRDDIVNRLSTNLESIDLNPATLAALEQTTPQVRGANVSDANPLPVNIQENPGTTVDSGVLEAVDVAPGASANLTGPVVGTGLTAKLIEITVSSSVRVKAVLHNMGTGAADRRVFFVKEGESFTYSPKDRDLLTATGTTGAWRLVVTNMDNLRTASIYASVSQVEV